MGYFPSSFLQLKTRIISSHYRDIPNVSKALRAEFARGDGRIKRKEDERRRNIAPSETLFVVNFHEETTRREDLEMLFSPFGELVRIDMKRNYAFVQFKTIEQATKAKETTNGGKLDQSVLTVEYVARQQRNSGGGGGGRDRGRRDRGRRGRDDRRSSADRGSRDDSYDRRSYDRRYEDEGRYLRRRDSPPPYRSRRSHSRSRSPPPRYGRRSRYVGCCCCCVCVFSGESAMPVIFGTTCCRVSYIFTYTFAYYNINRSPPRGRYDDRYDDYREYRRGPSPPGYRGHSPPDRAFNRGDRDRDRGYRG